MDEASRAEEAEVESLLAVDGSEEETIPRSTSNDDNSMDVDHDGDQPDDDEPSPPKGKGKGKRKRSEKNKGKGKRKRSEGDEDESQSPRQRPRLDDGETFSFIWTELYSLSFRKRFLYCFIVFLYCFVVDLRASEAQARRCFGIER